MALPAPVAVVGAGRAGLGLARALAPAGVPLTLLVRRARPDVALPLAGPGTWPAVLRTAGLVLLAVPDDAIGPVAAALAADAAPGAVALHCSGLLDRSVLAPLAERGLVTGSFHPCQALADPATVPERLRGAWAALEGEPGAVAVGHALAEALGMHAFEIAAAAKPRYHAAAVLASNYAVGLAGAAERVLAASGVPAAVAARVFGPLLAGTAANVTALGPAAALTGPVRRGDAGTVARHLAVLGPDDRRLYGRVALEALALARAEGLDPAKAAAVERLLREAAG